MPEYPEVGRDLVAISTHVFISVYSSPDYVSARLQAACYDIVTCVNSSLESPADSRETKLEVAPMFGLTSHSTSVPN
jgi:hypothetical protein